MTVHDASVRLIAVVQQTNYLGSWSLVPDGRFEGAAVTELPNEWRHVSSIPTAPTFYAQLSVHVEEGTQGDTRLPPFAGMHKSDGGGGFRGGPVDGGGRGGRGGRGGPSVFYPPYGRGGRGVAGDSTYPAGGGWGGHAAAPQMARTGGSFSGMSASSGSIGYGSAVGSPDVYGDARGGGGDSAGGGALIDRSLSGASSAGSGMGMLTAIAEPAFPYDAAAPPGARGRHSSMTVPSAPRVPVSMRRHQSAGFVQRESSSHSSRDGSFRFSLGAADMPSVGEAPVASGRTLDGPTSEPLPPPPPDGRLRSPVGSYAPSPLRSPVGSYVPSPLLDMSRQLEEEEEGVAPGAGQQQEEKRDDGFRAAFKRPSIEGDGVLWSRPGSSLAKERGETEERMEEVKTERRFAEDVEQPSAAPATASTTPGSRKRIFSFARLKTSSSGSRGSSAAASSSTSESELQPSRRRLAAAPSTASAPDAEEKEEGKEQGKGAPSGAKKALGKLAAAVKISSRQKKAKGMVRAPDMMPGAAPPPPPPPRSSGRRTRASVDSSRTMGESTLAPPPPPLTPPPTYSDALELRHRLPPSGASFGAATMFDAPSLPSYPQPQAGAPPLPDRGGAAEAVEAEVAASDRRLAAAIAAAREQARARDPTAREHSRSFTDALSEAVWSAAGPDSEVGYDTGRALGTEVIAPRAEGASRARGRLAFGVVEDNDEAGASAYSAMPQDSMGVIDSTVEGMLGRRPLYPVVGPRGHLGPSDSVMTMASENVPGDGRPVSRLLAQSTTSSSRSAAGSVMNEDTMVEPLPRRVMPPGRDPGVSSWFAPHPQKDPVIFSCFAPSAVTPGTAFDLTVQAFLRAARKAVLREAMAEGAAEAGRPGGVMMSKGTRVTVELNLPEHAFKLLQPVDSNNGPASVERLSVRDFMWAGETTGARFRVACIPGAPPGRVQCGAKIIEGIEGMRVTRLSFGIEVAEPGATPRALCDINGELDTVMEEVKDNVAQVPFDELEFVKELGKGVQGKTSHCRWRGDDVAVKSLASYPSFLPSTAPTRSGLEHEATILSLIGHHPNIVQFLGLSRRDEEIHIVTKLEEGGSMEGALGIRGGGTNGWHSPVTNGGSNGWNGRGSAFDGRTRELWAWDIARGLAFSHEVGVLHNDIASRNALLSSGGRGLLCDFGISRFLHDGGVAKAFLIDPEDQDEKWPVWQMPMESLKHPYPLTVESDAWMYGMFLYEVFEGKQPWAGLDKQQVKALIKEGKPAPEAPEMLRQRGDRLVKIYESCLSTDSTKRPSLEHVLDQFSPTSAPSDWTA
ncbi:unnamed protein product [Ectocarpus fasciculatus]